MRTRYKDKDLCALIVSLPSRNGADNEAAKSEAVQKFCQAQYKVPGHMTLTQKVLDAAM